MHRDALAIAKRYAGNKALDAKLIKLRSSAQKELTHQVLSSGANLLSPPVTVSTIGSRGLDCRVRNENGYDPSDKAPELSTRCASNHTKYAVALQITIVTRHTRTCERAWYTQFRMRDWTY